MRMVVKAKTEFAARDWVQENNIQREKQETSIGTQNFVGRCKTLRLVSRSTQNHTFQMFLLYILTKSIENKQELEILAQENRYDVINIC